MTFTIITYTVIFHTRIIQYLHHTNIDYFFLLLFFVLQQGFGFEDPDDDVFSNMGLRSRLNRMGHPFDWPARKRGGGTAGHPTAGQYDQYFDNDFPGFGSTWDAFNRMGNNKRSAGEPHGFFDYLPPEFRQHIPEGFGFGGMRQARSPPTQPHTEPIHQQHQPQHHQPQPQQQQFAPQTPQQEPTQPAAPRGNRCDAAIQTEDLSADPMSGANLNQHGLRNTTDLSQRAAQEDLRGDRAQSAPPQNQNAAGNNNQASAFASSTQTPAGAHNFTATSANGANAFANANANHAAPGHFFPGHQQFNYAPQHGTPPQSAAFHVPQYAPPFVQPHMSQPQPQQQPQQQQPPQPQQPQPAAGQNENIRNVPIFVEGRNEPIVVAAKNVSAQQQEPSPAPHPSTVPIPAPAPPPRAHSRPEPLVTKDLPPQGIDTTDEGAVPQTPHTIDCIAKIQAIQRDVLELMCAVEQFGGKRGDKEYGYLDEMLTRNLLKLDTIDTNGKENIRLARKEAIKCIQASIAVLEAKADLDLNSRKNSLEAEGAGGNADSAVEKMDVDVSAGGGESAQATGEAAVATDNAASVPEPATASDAAEQSGVANKA